MSILHFNSYNDKNKFDIIINSYTVTNKIIIWKKKNEITIVLNKLTIVLNNVTK